MISYRTMVEAQREIRDYLDHKGWENIPINKMTDSHLENAINKMVALDDGREIAAEFEGYIAEHFD